MQKYAIVLFRGVRTVTYRKKFREITTPVLILWGRHDFGMPVKQGRELERLIHGAHLVEIPRTGHNVSTEKPEYFAEQLLSFLLKESGGQV